MTNQLYRISYDLPDEKIAKYPLKTRDVSKLLIYKNGKISEDKFRNILEYISDDYLIIFNNTKVIYAKFFFRKPTGALIEIMLLEPLHPADYQENLSNSKKSVWLSIVGNSKKWKNGVLTIEKNGVKLDAVRVKKNVDNEEIEFSWNGGLSFAEILELFGSIPIPPYLNRASEEADKLSYQTHFSSVAGSVAAPTSGLHFSEKLLEKINKSYNTEQISLHIGAGTFKPIKTEKIEEHKMHNERFFFSTEFILRLISSVGKIVAVGTTSLRAIESIYWLAEKNYKTEALILSVNQWDWVEKKETKLTKTHIQKVLKHFYEKLKRNKLDYCEASTELMIVPGYKFIFAKKLITNFHQPKSTLLLLVAAFIGDDWEEVYNHALNNDFRFLSYGDSSLLSMKNLIAHRWHRFN